MYLLTINIFTNALRKFKGCPATCWMALQSWDTFHSVAWMALVSNFWKNRVSIFRRGCHKSVTYWRRWITKLKWNWNLRRKIFTINMIFDFIKEKRASSFVYQKWKYIYHKMAYFRPIFLHDMFVSWADKVYWDRDIQPAAIIHVYVEQINKKHLFFWKISLIKEIKFSSRDTNLTWVF